MNMAAEPLIFKEELSMLNTITIMGRMVRDPEIRQTGNGTSVCNFSLAVDRDYTDQNGDRETDFIDCVVWAHTADFVSKYFGKGDLMAVSGRLQLREWEDNDGNRRRAAEIKVDNVYFGGGKRDKSDEQSSKNSRRNERSSRRGRK